MKVLARFGEGSLDITARRALDAQREDENSQLVTPADQAPEPAILESVGRVADLGHLELD